MTTAAGRTEPGWDGQVHAVIGVSAPHGTVLSVPPDAVAATAQLAAEGGLHAVAAGLGTVLHRPDHVLQAGVFRWCERPASAEDLPDAGTWLPFEHPVVPPWLRPFGAEVLVCVVEGTYAAGVGIKRHDRFGQELAVGTDEAFQGRGLGRRLVAQAARRLVGQGIVATYLHDPANTASAKVAEAAGFPDRGWLVLGLWPEAA